MTTPHANSYDEIIYESQPFPQSHPDRLAAVARLLGLTTPDPRTCRVLELGCAAGGNLIPMAVALPNAQFVGVDLSAAQITLGRATIQAIGLDNIELHHSSIEDVDDTWGSFDYVIAHGVYSWVPVPIRDKLLDICARHLSPHGVAYVSYNTLPGWHTRRIARDIMLYHATQFTDPAERIVQARAMLEFMAQSVPTETGVYATLLKAMSEDLRQEPDYYIAHDLMEEDNTPVYFHEFVSHAARHGLKYLAEAKFHEILASPFQQSVLDTVMRVASGAIRQHQLLDFLHNRTLRQSLLVRQELQPDPTITAERLTGLWIASPLRAESAEPELATDKAERFIIPDFGSMTTAEPITKAALHVLQDHWPKAVPYDELLAAARQRLGRESRGDANKMGTELLMGCARKIVELHGMPSAFTTVPGTRPLASPLARHQARRGVKVTNLRHESLSPAPDDTTRRFMALLDGTRDEAELKRLIPGISVASALKQIAGAALMLA